jgi:hypothetical protein
MLILSPAILALALVAQAQPAEWDVTITSPQDRGRSACVFGEEALCRRSAGKSELDRIKWEWRLVEAGLATRVLLPARAELLARESGMAEVRIADGPHRGLAGWIALDGLELVGRDRDRERAEAARARRQAEALARRRVAQQFRQAGSLESAGNTKGAIALYRSVVSTFPESPEAKSARSRLEALGVDAPAPKVSPPAGRSTAYEEGLRDQAARRRERARSRRSAAGDAGSDGGLGGFVGSLDGGGPGGGICGAPCQDGHPCRNRVSGGGFCYLHR